MSTPLLNSKKYAHQEEAIKTGSLTLVRPQNSLVLTVSTLITYSGLTTNSHFVFGTIDPNSIYLTTSQHFTHLFGVSYANVHSILRLGCQFH